MKKVVSCAEIIAAEERIMSAGIDVDVLIKGSADAIYTYLEDKIKKTDKVLIFVGGGNNGCDGLELCFTMTKCGYDCNVIFVGDRFNHGIEKRRVKLEKIGVKILSLDSDIKADIIIDCIFGIGINKEPLGDYRLAIEKINSSKAYVYSVDIPSGLSGNFGAVYDTVVCANETLTLSVIKQGLLINGGRNFTGKITVLDNQIVVEDCSGFLIEDRDAVIQKRKTDSHKGNYGNIKIIGGSSCMPGAVKMTFRAATSALRAGSGKVTLCYPKSLADAYRQETLENMLFELPDDGSGNIVFDKETLQRLILGTDVIAIGMGMGNNPMLIKIIEYIVTSFDGIVLIDADGLNALAGNLGIIKSSKARLILTPHIGEFKRLKGDSNAVSPQEVKEFAKKYGVTLAVKSATTMISDGEKVYYNTSGTPALAKGGSGDVLSGIISAFAAVNSPLDAVIKGCYHFGKIAERVAKNLSSDISVLASDVIIETKASL